ncbi:sugar-binding transcriptional regulator [Prosthecodimorpha staleyi]|uniref:Helix-turn-helix domain-containing protein n=1 Tax=Prosthecodimorpha staleyi TaxID=2840188 RepID=A0A947D6I6_9HYPH|nr:sugar-binding domain-containing protein [Prosthecodimorpha staleyi]MBT9289027.1 helix-turn-helix domain-containing protein [Prosthecodimorpha staleyi]
MARNRRDEELILRIARMRYDQKLPQHEIARQLAVSESTISRALKAAMDLGFVEIQITPYAMRDFELERRLVARFGLEFAVVVQPRAGAHNAYEILGRALARTIEDRLVPGAVLGVSDGDTVAAVAAAIRRGKTSDVDVVSLIGGVGAPQIPSHSSEVCRMLAAGLGGRAWQLPVPAIVDDAVAAKALLDTAAVRSVFETMRRSTIALVGVGSMSPRATVFRHGVIDPGYIRTIAAKGAIGTICGRFFGADGKPVPSDFDDRTLSVTLAELAAVPLGIAAAVGAAKAPAIRAAVAGRLVNALGTDSETARALLDG